MEYLGNTIAVTVEDLTRSDGGDAVMTRGNYNNLVSRGNITVLRPGKGLGHPALIEYASLPQRFKDKFESKYGNPERILAREREQLRMDEQARSFYASFRLEDGTALKSDKQEEYLLNASVLLYLIGLENTQRSRRHMSGNSTPVNWDGIYGRCESLRATYGHTLPESTRCLREKMREFRRDGYSCLVSKKLSNTNSTKITAAAGRYIIALKRSVVPVYTIQQIFDKFNSEAERKGFKPLKSINTLLQYLDRPEVVAQWKDRESGELAAKNLLQRKFDTILPTRRDTLWYEDGTRLNLYYKKYVPGEGYKAAALQVCEVVDAFSEVLIGCNISEAENFESIYEALRNAVENTGFLPVELVTDNQGGTRRGDAQAFLAKIAKVARTTTPNNPTSKTIEAIFGRFQKQVLHQYWYFTGQNITARSEKSRVNAEFVLANVQSLPTREEVIATYMSCREQWNSMPHPEYLRPRKQLYAESVNEEAVAVSPVLAKELFWLRTRDEVAYTASGITITINKQQYKYEVIGADGMPDVRFLSSNAGRKFVVEYDPHNMETVRLNLLDKNYGLQYVCDAKPYIRNHRAIQDQKEGERSFIALQDMANKKERVRRDLQNHALEMEFGVAPEQHGLQTPRLKGITDKEYERFADEIMAETAEVATVPDELPTSIGRIEKEQSNMDIISILDRM